MANLSNINNKLLVGTNGEVRIGDTATIADVKLRVKQTANQWVQQIISTGGGYGLSIDTSASSYGIAGSLQIYTNAGVGFKVQNNGFVGIGTSSPATQLHVESDNPIITLQRNNNGNASGALQFRGSDNVVDWQMGTNQVVGLGLEFNFQNSNKVYIETGGNVGIGITDPLSKLHISGQSGTTGLPSLLLYGESPATGQRYGFNVSADQLDISALGTNGRIGFYTGGNASSITQKMRIDSGGSIIIGDGATSGTPTGDYRSLEIGRQGNTITGAPWKSNLYFSTNATITAGSTTFTYRYASEAPARMDLEDGNITFYNAAAGSVGSAISFTERMRIHDGGSITMGEVNSTNAPNNGILKIKTLSSTAGTCYPLLSIMGSTHLATRQYGIGMDPEGYSNRVKMFFGVDGMGNGYSYGDFVWNINTQVGNDIVSPTDERMRLDKGGDLKLKTGNLAITDTSKGILLGGTGTANQLRIYQHGTWTPQIYYQNATDQANATNSTQVGLYTRIGNMCMVQFRLVWNQASGTPAVDNIGIKNLPFQGSTTNTYAEVPCFIKNYTGGPSPRGNLTLTLPGANSNIALFNDTNFVGNMGNAIGSGTKEIRFSFTYTTNG
jgi:hypothetical protein